MSNYTQERYAPVIVGADSRVVVNSNTLGGFFCTAAGALTITVNKQDGKPSYTLLTLTSLVANTWYRLPFYLGTNGAVATTSGGGAGVLAA